MNRSNNSKDSTANVPYSNIGNDLLDVIFEALFRYHQYRTKSNSSKNENTNQIKVINNLFEEFFETNKANRDYKHLKIGHYLPDQRKGIVPRLSALVANSYDDIQMTTTIKNGVAIPSPLNILFNSLIVPDEPSSTAYALAYCRTLLFERYKVFPAQPDRIVNYNDFDIRDIQTALSTFNSSVKDLNNIPKKNKPDKIQLMIAQYLSMKGIFYLRFGSIGRKVLKNSKDIDKVVKEFFDSKDIDGGEIENQLFEFRINEKYSELPDEGEIYNELSGIPLPIRGLDTIFYGGLRKDSEASLVIRVSGTPGVGKTSFALSLAATLSPLNTQTYYMSLEEHPNDLENRLNSLIPEFLKKIPIFDKDINNWFYAEKVKLGKENKIQELIQRYLFSINERIKHNKLQADSFNLLPTICPILIVIDSIRGLLTEDYQHIEDFVSQCRSINAVIVLISSSTDENNRDLDYLVDVVINLNQVGFANQNEKPTRTFQLVKSRHQLSRPGTHLFHLSGEHKFRVSPQIPSQLDKKDKIKRPNPSDDSYIDVFYDSDNDTGLKIFLGSQILLHGHGSSGKAGLGLKILLSRPKSTLPSNFPRRKILIISFLYEELYYKKLFKDFEAQSALEYKGLNPTQKPKMKALCFFAGFLSPEDMVNKIIRTVEASFYEGEPFTGVLIDGLHNVSLQFRSMKDIDLIYPALYGILVKYGLTVVTTFTNFLLNVDDSSIQKDKEILLEGHKPLLHAIVKPTDYYFLIESPPEELMLQYETEHKSNQKEKNNKKISSLNGQYIVSIKSAIRYNFKGSNKYFWDRENKKLVFYEDLFPKK